MDERVYHPSASPAKKGEAAKWQMSAGFLAVLDGVQAGADSERVSPLVVQGTLPQEIPTQLPSEQQDMSPELSETTEWVVDVEEMLPFRVTIGLVEGAWLHVEWARAG
jgi:hypothetical protein